MKKASAVIPAAGSGERLGKGINKVLVPVAGRPILAHTLSVFECCDAVDEIIIVTGERDIEAVGELVDRFGFAKVAAIVAGGAQRQDSVMNGLAKVTREIVSVHDAARPMITPEIITASIQKADEMGACIVAVPVIDTIKSALTGTIDRANLYAVQTPQTFRTDILKKAYDHARENAISATDDAALVEAMGCDVAIVAGSYENFKITTPADLKFAATILGGSKMRTGIGYDVHAFAEGRKLFLGGVEIEHELGLAGHSDADVVLHAIADAVLGAAALGDIGRHFPDTDPKYKGADSKKLLSTVREIIASDGWRITNIDAIVICQRPKIAPYVNEMSKRIGECLGIDPSCVSVKGTTTEGLGFTGRGEGIACQAIATIGAS